MRKARSGSSKPIHIQAPSGRRGRKTDKPKRFFCEGCGRGFASRNGLKYHRKRCPEIDKNAFFIGGEVSYSQLGLRNIPASMLSGAVKWKETPAPAIERFAHQISEYFSASIREARRLAEFLDGFSIARIEEELRRRNVRT